MVKIGHVINVAQETLDLTEMDAAKIEVGCDSIDTIAKKFNIIIGRQLCKINIRITTKISGLCTSMIMSMESKQNTSSVLSEAGYDGGLEANQLDP